MLLVIFWFYFLLLPYSSWNLLTSLTSHIQGHQINMAVFNGILSKGTCPVNATIHTVYTGQVTFYKRPVKHGHVYMFTLLYIYSITSKFWKHISKSKLCVHEFSSWKISDLDYLVFLLKKKSFRIGLGSIWLKKTKKSRNFKYII